jgi:bifunctional non-homologous end joining protein LigD
MRARAGAPVSVPLRWEELTEDLKPASFTVENAAERLAGPDPWAGFAKTRQPLGTGTKKSRRTP